MRDPVSCLITDLDNTLYDWVTYFARSFERMVAVAAPLLETDLERLRDDLREVHRRHGNTEQPYALLETRAVERRFPSLSRSARKEALQPAFAAFNDERDRTLRLYAGVAETLQAVQASGALVVGHTEASVANARFRLHKLGITRYFDALFASADRGPGHPSPHGVRVAPDAPPVRHLAPHECKPDPRVLQDICCDLGVALQDTLYVGDSVSRDIGMAAAAGVRSAWAAYGTRYSAEHWQQIVRVSHWTDEDVERVRAVEQRLGATRPDVVLDGNLAQVLAAFEFVRFNSLRPAQAGHVPGGERGRVLASGRANPSPATAK